jgi:AAHS family 4-hydroxybenzoate transporter-like MFS transporter
MAGRTHINTVDVSRFIDDCNFGPVQLRVLVICILIAAVEGFDAQAIGYIAPTLSADWHLRPGALGPLFSTGLFGLMMGALFIAPLADRVGRRPILLWSLLIFGVTTLATAVAPNLTVLTILRFVTGLGLGGAMPNAVSLTSEYMPRKHRAFMVIIMFNGFNVGSMLGGIISAHFVGTLGWRAVFVVGGVLPLLVAVAVFFRLPESIAFLAVRSTSLAKITGLLQLMDPKREIREDVCLADQEATLPAAKIAVRELFTQGRAVTTVLLWVIFFMSLLDIYLLVSWLPTALNAGGAPVATAITAGIVLQLGSVIGCFPLGWALDRFGAPIAMTCAYILGAICIASIGAFSSNIPVLLLVTFGAGFGLIAGQAAANALSSTSYPTEVRSTGVGWALGIGRVGSIIGPLLGGAFIGASVSIQNLFLFAAVPAAVAAVALVALGVSTSRQNATLARAATPAP